MKSSIEELEEKAYRLGERYERECTGCAQTALAAIFDALGIENDDVFRSASGLADGLGLTGDGSCGALVGGALAIGYLFGRKRQDLPDMMKPMKSYLLVKELHDAFVKKYGTCRCADLQTSLMGRTFKLLNPKQFKEAMEFGMMDYCMPIRLTQVRVILQGQGITGLSTRRPSKTLRAAGYARYGQLGPSNREKMLSSSRFRG